MSSMNSNVKTHKEETMKTEEGNDIQMIKSSNDGSELEELTKTRLMRVFVEAQDPSSKLREDIRTQAGLITSALEHLQYIQILGLILWLRGNDIMESNVMELECKKAMKDEAKEADNGMKSSTGLEELTRTRRVRAYVEAKDPFSMLSKEVDDPTIRRFLGARDLDVEQASAMFLRYLKWRRTFVPKGSISASEVPNQIAQNKMFSQGSDKEGRPIMVVLGARHFQNKEFKRFVVYGLDKICARIPPGQEKFVAIGDLEGWGYSNSDIRGYLGALSILQDYYPERLGKLFIVHAPLIFMTVWKIVYPFIDNKTKKKIVFVENKMLKSTLLEEIEESQIPEIYGGQLPLVPI